MTKTFNINKGSVQASFTTLGAECTSLTYNGREYLWKADPAVWGRHAPVLFPFVGKLKDNSYIHQNKAYPMGQHGFARDREFQLAEQDEHSLTFVLESDEESLMVFPFSFRLTIRYMLTETGMKVSYKVYNPSTDALLFSIGAHPGFTCPLQQTDESFSDYEIDFLQKELDTLSLYQLEGGLIGDKKIELPLQEGKLPLSYSLFENDALILDLGNLSKIQVRSKKTGAGFGMGFSGFQWLGLWTKAAGAGFLCIEPWNGIADTVGHDLRLEHKLGIQKLLKDQSHASDFEIFLFS